MHGCARGIIALWNLRGNTTKSRRENSRVSGPGGKCYVRASDAEGEQQTVPPSRDLFSLTEPLEPWFRKILDLNFSAGQFSASRQQVVHSVKHLLCRLLHSLTCTQRHPHTRKAIFAMPSNECLTNRSSFSRSPLLSLFSLSLSPPPSLYQFDKRVPLRMCTYFIIYCIKLYNIS